MRAVTDSQLARKRPTNAEMMSCDLARQKEILCFHELDDKITTIVLDYWCNTGVSCISNRPHQYVFDLFGRLHQAPPPVYHDPVRVL